MGLSAPGTSLTLFSFELGAADLHCGCCSSQELCRVSAAQHHEVKDAPGSLGWLEHFLGSLAGVHLAPAEPEVMAVVLQLLKADKVVRN